MSLRTWGHLPAKVGTSKRVGKQWQTASKKLAQDAAYDSHTGHLTGLWFLPKLALVLNTGNKNK
jgi:hypothetical protein